LLASLAIEIIYCLAGQLTQTGIPLFDELLSVCRHLHCSYCWIYKPQWIRIRWRSWQL